MSTTAFERIKTGLLEAIQHQRRQRSGVVVINPKAANRFDAKRKTWPQSAIQLRLISSAKSRRAVI